MPDSTWADESEPEKAVYLGIQIKADTSQLTTWWVIPKITSISVVKSTWTALYREITFISASQHHVFGLLSTGGVFLYCHLGRNLTLIRGMPQGRNSIPLKNITKPSKKVITNFLSKSYNKKSLDIGSENVSYTDRPYVIPRVFKWTFLKILVMFCMMFSKVVLNCASVLRRDEGRFKPRDTGHVRRRQEDCPRLQLEEGGPWLPDGYSQIFRQYVFGPSGFCGQFHKIRYAAKRQLLLSPKPDSQSYVIG